MRGRAKNGGLLYAVGPLEPRPLWFQRGGSGGFAPNRIKPGAAFTRYCRSKISTMFSVSMRTASDLPKKKIMW